MRDCVRACVDGCVRASMVRGYVRVSERAFVRVCARINAQHGETERHNNLEFEWTLSNPSIKQRSRYQEQAISMVKFR